MLTAPFAKQALNWGEQRLVWRDLFAEVSRGSVVVAADELSLFVGYVSDFWGGTDMSKFTRKPSKTGKHGHEKRKSTREAKDSKPKPEKVKLQSIVVKKSKKVN
ncbi:hypothetical protein Tco_0341488, partial [Tanacetum coccineum]